MHTCRSRQRIKWDVSRSNLILRCSRASTPTFVYRYVQMYMCMWSFNLYVFKVSNVSCILVFIFLFLHWKDRVFILGKNLRRDPQIKLQVSYQFQFHCIQLFECHAADTRHVAVRVVVVVVKFASQNSRCQQSAMNGPVCYSNNSGGCSDQSIQVYQSNDKSRVWNSTVVEYALQVVGQGNVR